MARGKQHGKNARASAACANGPIAGHSKPKTHGWAHYKPKSHDNTNPEINWDAIPLQAKAFILDNPEGMFPLPKLIKFWSDPENIASTRGSAARTVCAALYYLALFYLQLRKFREARALTINGSFIHQCYNSSIQEIQAVFGLGLCKSENLSNGILLGRMPYYARGLNSIQSPEMMESHLRRHLPKENLTSCDKSDPKVMSGLVDQISDDWKGSSSKNRHHQSSSSTDDASQIKLVLVDDANKDGCRSFDIGSSTTLKVLFNDYADYRGISLRLLRFSYAGKTLFLSSAGHKTPKELSMQDRDVIKVHDTSKSEEQSSDNNGSSSQSRHSTSKKSKAKKRSNKKVVVKKKKLLQQEPTMTLEEHKVQHSKQLTKIHDEAQTQFKQIRQRLNNLVIFRSQPKTKSKRPRTPKSEPSVSSIVDSHFKEDGKAGKSHYTIHVGEVQNLYKTTKPNAMLASHPSASAPLETLDLHGCTREEALIKLDESLKVWVDAAMRGSYPFVQSAVIVCGCGNQILSEVTSNWIRSNHNVSNAPKLKSSMK
ncbi:hypothetical protein ACHAXR_004211 [Thalassiosira sp. AJA248-18]